MSVAETIADKLRAGLEPTHLEILDESERHRGHAGWRDGGETHFRIIIVSERFAGLNRLARHRAVNVLLAAELAGPVHALSLRALTPDEAPGGEG